MGIAGHGAVRVPSQPTLCDEFLDLVLGDEELLRAEFEGIIAASWRPPTPPPAPPEPADRQPLPLPASLPEFVVRRWTTPLIAPSTRERSPPHRWI
jgi:hypothetical protein